MESLVEGWKSDWQAVKNVVFASIYLEFSDLIYVET